MTSGHKVDLASKIFISCKSPIFANRHPTPNACKTAMCNIQSYSISAHLESLPLLVLPTSKRFSSSYIKVDIEDTKGEVSFNTDLSILEIKQFSMLMF